MKTGSKTDRATDLAYMRAALALARRALGTTWPNPSVGCVLVRDGVIVGRGRTAAGGRPHAETEALAMAGEKARGATAYVTLEPCAHHGRTPPCAEALVRAGVRRVVYACPDPDPRVNGGGGAILAAAGIAVESGVGATEAEEIHAGFFLRIRSGRPLVTLKLATTLDGRIAAAGGRSQWITGPAARAAAHALRASHDGVMVGAATLATDDPALTVRLPGLPERAPLRIAVLGRGGAPPRRKLFDADLGGSVWLIVAKGAAAPSGLGLSVEIVTVAGGEDGRPDPAAVLAELGRRGVTRVLLEGGGRLAASLVRAQLVDRLVWFRSSTIMGGDGLPALEGLGVTDPAAAPAWRRSDVRHLGPDLMETYEAVR